jgi:hypothetical protein
VLSKLLETILTICGNGKLAAFRIVACFLIFSFAIGTANCAPSKLSVVEFSGPAHNALTLTFSEPVGGTQILFPNVPAELDFAAAGKNVRPVTAKDRSVTIQLSESAATPEYSVLLVVTPRLCPTCQPSFVEFVRQPAGWLKAKFGFEKRGGYTILGRRSLSVRGGTRQQQLPPIRFPDRVRISPTMQFRAPPQAIASYPELVRAGQILQYLWSVPLRTGPGKNPPNFERLNFGDQIAAIRTGRATVECQGMRDLFLHALSGEYGIQARAVSAENYVTAFPGLLGYTHATSEIWVRRLHKWITIDAWEGAIFISADGVPLSASDLQTTHVMQIRVVELVPALPRYVLSGSGQKTPLPDAPLELVRYTNTPAGAAAGYRNYFSHLSYRMMQHS